MTDPPGFLAADLVDETEVAIERSLRPRSLDEYLGQREVKAGLAVLLGITPDVPVTLTADDAAAKRDPQLDSAVKLLLGK